MAAQYLTAEYCYERFGESLTVALTTKLGGTLEKAIESATASVRKDVAALGFSAPATTSDEFLMSATFAALWLDLANTPKASLKLPDNFDATPYMRDLESIRDGSASKYLAEVAGLTIDTATAIGGSLWTDTSSTSTNPKRTTSDELAGY